VEERESGKKTGPEEIWSVIFCSGCVESSGCLNGDKGSAIDIWYEVGKWIKLFFYRATAHNGPGPPHCRGFTMTLIHAALGRTPLDE
jgi:hypothetical protein